MCAIHSSVSRLVGEELFSSDIVFDIKLTELDTFPCCKMLTYSNTELDTCPCCKMLIYSDIRRCPLQNVECSVYVRYKYF